MMGTGGLPGDPTALAAHHEWTLGCQTCQQKAEERAERWEIVAHELAQALRDIRIWTRSPHNTDLVASMSACGIDVCMGCLIEGTAEQALAAFDAEKDKNAADEP